MYIRLLLLIIVIMLVCSLVVVNAKYSGVTRENPIATATRVEKTRIPEPIVTLVKPTPKPGWKVYLPGMRNNG